MIEQQSAPAPVAPSKGAIVKATVIALALALLILFTIVLPAEYGIDPLRTGAALGLTGLATTTDTSTGGRATPAQAGINTPQNALYKLDAEDIGLHPGQAIEMKYHLRKGAVMVYAWKASGKVQFEFHGEPDQKPRPDYFESYVLDNKTGQDHSYGSFTAPTTGMHGWFLQNKGTQDVRIRLTVTGFFDSAKMFAGGPPEDLTVDDVNAEVAQ
jgi:hypothetical protein